MGRPRKLWQRAGSDYFYTKIDGKQVRLEKTERASQKKLENILRGTHTGPQDSGLTFSRLAEKFLDHSEGTNEGETYQVHRLVLQSVKDFIGGSRLVARLCEADLDAWERKLTDVEGEMVKAGGRKGGTRAARPWGENSRARARAIVLACLNYGVKKLALAPHPLTHVRPGTVGKRERYLTPEERIQIREKVKGAFAEYISALEQTGARPFSEVAKVTAANVDLEAGTWTLSKWKNSRKQKGKDRVIYLVPPMLELTKQLIHQYSEGPIFRNKIGKAWTRQALTARFRKLGEFLKIDGLSGYNYRTAYITDALTRGVPVAVVAELCGTSIQTINKHYANIDKKQDFLREAANKALAGWEQPLVATA